MKRINIAFVGLLFTAFPLLSQTINIPADHPTIQEGIDAASEGDTVLVQEGLYYENIDFLGKAITVASLFLTDGDTTHISRTIIDGSQPVNPDTASVVRLISGEDSTSVLCGFKITRGSGMYIDKYLTDKYPPLDYYVTGGGIAIIDGGATIKNNIITNNSVDRRDGRVADAGGISVIMSARDKSDNKSVIIENNIISNNLLHGDHSGGAGMTFYVDSSNISPGMSIIVQGNIFTGNRITVSAGSTSGVVAAGILVGFRLPIRSGDYLIRNNTICNNSIRSSPKPDFGEGGAMYIFYLGSVANSNNGPKIYNNIIADNYAPDYAGGIGIYSWGERTSNISPLIFNNTVVNNKSPISPGLDLVRVKSLVVNNIFSNQGDNTEPAEIRLNTSSALSYNNMIRGTNNTGQGNIDDVPSFVEDTYNLEEGSPGIGVGISSVEIGGVVFNAPGTDYYGNLRPNPVDMRVDIGALESSFSSSINIPDTDFLKSLYPNPVNNILTIETTSSLICDIEINSINGQLIYSTRMDGSIKELDMSGYGMGLYLVTIKSDAWVRTEKIVKL